MFSDRRIRTSLVAIAADILLTLIKLITSWVTGSAALLADAYHSLSDILVSVTLLTGLAIRVGVERGNLPLTDEKAHKLEAVLAILMACLILYVPVEIIQEVSSQEPEELQHLWVGILGILLCIAIAWLMSRLKTWVGRETDSLALVADGYHSQLDVFSSIAVLVSLIGTMIGIYLDEIVAVIIAVMVTIAGLELFVSGCRSLITGSEFTQISVLEKLNSEARVQGLKHSLIRLRQPKIISLFCSVLLSVYLLSGFRLVPYGHVGYSHWFHHYDSGSLSNGIHYVAPWPLGGLILIPTQAISSINTDAELLNADDTVQAMSGLWQKRPLGQSRQVTGMPEYFLTRDESLVDIRISLHYRVSPKAQRLSETQVQQELVRSYADAALVMLAAKHDYASLLYGAKQPLENELSLKLKEDLAKAGFPLTYIKVYIQTIKAPPLVVESHHETFNADQKMRKAKLNADSERQEELANASAQAMADISQAQAEKIEQVERAQGDLNRYLPMQSLFQKAPEALIYQQEFNQTSRQFRGKSLTIIDPLLRDEQIRLWRRESPAAQ